MELEEQLRKLSAAFPKLFTVCDGWSYVGRMGELYLFVGVFSGEKKVAWHGSERIQNVYRIGEVIEEKDRAAYDEAARRGWEMGLLR